MFWSHFRTICIVPNNIHNINKLNDACDAGFLIFCTHISDSNARCCEIRRYFMRCVDLDYMGSRLMRSKRVCPTVQNGWLRGSSMAGGKIARYIMEKHFSSTKYTIRYWKYAVKHISWFYISPVVNICSGHHLWKVSNCADILHRDQSVTLVLMNN